MLAPVVSSDSYRRDLSFGWCGATHKEICYRLMKKYNPLLPQKMRFDYDMLVKIGSVQPDLDRKKIVEHIHGHFVDPDNFSKDPPDAYHLALTYTQKALKAHKEGNYGKRDLYIGYASHFILDSLQPYHANGFRAQAKNHPERIAHNRFERLAKDLQNIALKGATLDNLDEPRANTFFKEVFPASIKEAKKLYERLSQNSCKSEDNAVAIATVALDNAYKTMNIYFKMLIDKLSINNR